MTANPDIENQIKAAVDKVLESIERERERDVIERRFGLTGQKETLELVGELLGITRERVRQIEKATLIRAKLSLDDGKNPTYDAVEKEIIKALVELGRAAKIDDLTAKVVGRNDQAMRYAIVFLAELSGKILVTTENDKYYQGAVLTANDDDREIKKQVDDIVATLKQHGTPVTVDQLFALTSGYEHPNEAKAIASLSKQVSTLRGLWGLSKWPEVNPRNIRDKIMVVLTENNQQPMHFSEIAEAIKQQDFKRNNVTPQAIHNELIKDPRFILVGRGLYGLVSWGYRAGTLSDIITDILKHEQPLHREQIIRLVLKQRHIREATILLALQNNKSFKRVGKSQYALSDYQPR
jgi:Holliday junction resolvasome RuvABC DNA-binding subunit